VSSETPPSSQTITSLIIVISWLDDKRRDGWSAPPIERLYVGRSKNAEAPLAARSLQVFPPTIGHLEGAHVGLPGTMLPRMGRTPIDG
jgi:hypothetical protein